MLGHTGSDAIGTSYVVITPARDEVEHLSGLADALRRQTILPACWFIVDDGSRDGTAELATNLTTALPWCRLIRLPDRGRRLRGKGVVDAFYAAYRLAEGLDFDALAKVDADVSFGPNTFEELMARLRSRPRLGICGGGIVIQQRPGQWCPDRSLPITFVRGPMKLYRRACFEDIGGLVPHKGWDAIDDITAMTRRWEVERFDDLPVRHHRYLGDATGVIRSSFENGLGGYFMGSLFAWNLHEALQFMRRKPYVVRGVAMVAGFVWGMLTIRRYSDSAVIRFIQEEQRNLLRGARPSARTPQP